jgi:hypothetical protein
VVAADGKLREAFCVHLDCLPMWLATIETSRVAEHVRPKLVCYQREATKVLADYFFGRSQSIFRHPSLLTAESLTACLSSCERVLSIGGMEERDRVLLKDFARDGMLVVTGRHLQLANAVALVISNRCGELGYPRPKGGQEKQIGRLIARRYRAKHGGQNPPQRAQHVDGAVRNVNHYTMADLDVVDAGIHSFFGGATRN